MPAYTIRLQRTFLPAIRRVTDIAIVGSSLYFSQSVIGQSPSDSTAIASLAAVLVYLIVAELTGAYHIDYRCPPGRELLRVMGSWLLSLAILAMLAFFTRHGEEFARSSILSWAALAAIGLGFLRMVVRATAELLSARGWGVRRCAIVGYNQLGWSLAANARSTPASGMSISGFYDDRDPGRLAGAELPPEPLLGRLENLVAEAKAGRIDTVFIALPMRAEARIRWLLDQLGDTTASTYIVPDFFVFELLHSRWTQIGGLPAVSVFESPIYGVDGWLKRGFDIVAAGCGLLVISPVMLACAALVKLSSPGPVFFRQRRYGLDGKEILVWKFRSMRTCDNGPVIQQATKEDPRITPVGRILRRTSLDELPQLFNVLDGSMSLVGPRPHASAHNEHYRKLVRGYMLRHKVRPGITGLAQVEGFRGETETLDKMQKRVDYDHRYIREWSLWLDLKILIKTAFVVLKRENAY
jgi:putative colanic acid biosysnthesis UDP-glucose lipid carrier transferase